MVLKRKEKLDSNETSTIKSKFDTVPCKQRTKHTKAHSSVFTAGGPFFKTSAASEAEVAEDVRG